ncbi:MAG: DMT family transporter [Burkholderiaceae bacterium]|nr:DMT family transporter [Burkholderiaceae bacterium]MCD8516175.1 DMT family transporter [Burkholderiaceae bacterium]MCD8536706.1 DMT family transporter [Burkholderiaceae bacterium]MCD8566183.1 DMT family transporter [Burkholderiaceae bacterium]
MQKLSIVWIGPLFVLVWSTGFIVAKYGMPYTDPMTFLTLRFAGVLVVMVPLSLWWRPSWPTLQSMAHIAVAGLLMHVGYLGGVWTAIKLGMPAGLTALIVGLQPVLTAFLAARLAEKVSMRQWAGLVFGFGGVAIVLADNLGFDGVTFWGVLLCFIALISFTAGTIYQKHFCPMFDLRAGTMIQYAASMLVAGLMMVAFEPMTVQWTVEMIGALVWSVLFLSIGAMSLWFVLLRQGAATRVSTLFYLTPPTVAVMAWILFDEALSLWVALGTLVTVVGVWLVTRSK